MNAFVSKHALMNKFAEFVRRSNNSDFERTPTWNDAVTIVESEEDIEIKCNKCVLHNACTYERGLGENGFCSQWIGGENG